ncbi:MAG: hypothetical protein EZS28_028946, partial [Streblomastix strix]
MGGTKAKL